jgi:hypothetical protein
MALLVGLLAGLGLPVDAQPAKGDRALLGVFTATSPCADCSSHRVELTLYARSATDQSEGTFELREIFTFVVLTSGERGPDRVTTTSGRWSRGAGPGSGPATVVYRLNPDKPAESRSFLRVNDEELRELENGLDPQASTLSLRRMPTAAETDAGGFRTTAVDAPDVKAAAQFAVLAESTRRGAALGLGRIVSAERQVVSGLNFRMCLDVSGQGESIRTRVVVYRDLNGHLALASWFEGGCR